MINLILFALFGVGSFGFYMSERYGLSAVYAFICGMNFAFVIAHFVS